MVGGWDPRVDLLDDDWDTLPPEVTDAALQVAVATLWALSGRRFGLRDILLAPYLPARNPGYVTTYPTVAGVSLVGVGVATGVGLCGTDVYARLRLPGPVHAVTHVDLDGTTFPDWVADPDGTLVRTDGLAWPIAQNVYSPRWLVTYTHGIAPPDEANIAAARYALEVGRGMTADPACRLPARTRDITRQGIAVTLTDPTDLTTGGLTGVPAVDAWLRAVNPAGLPEAPSLSGMNTARHRTLTITDVP
jgi:hypothetical protein